MAENALEAFNRRDYAAWSANWSESMEAAIDEEAFLAFQKRFQERLGDYIVITGVTGISGSDPGTYRWTFDVEFAKAAYRM